MCTVLRVHEDYCSVLNSADDNVTAIMQKIKQTKKNLMFFSAKRVSSQRGVTYNVNKNKSLPEVALNFPPKKNKKTPKNINKRVHGLKGVKTFLQSTASNGAPE